MNSNCFIFKVWCYLYVTVATDKLGVTFSYYGVQLASYPNFEFRRQFNNSVFTIGSMNESFVGFMKKFIATNRLNDLNHYQDSSNICSHTQYLFDQQCFECGTNCPSLKICARDSCNLCYSQNCSDCDGYLMSDCKACSSGSLPDCSFGFHCMIGSLFNCLECEKGFYNNEGICIHSPYYPVGFDFTLSGPVVNARFNSFEQFYDIFQSGSNPGTWYSNNPDDDDPVYYTSRGIYIKSDKENYMKTKVNISLNYNFTILMWIYQNDDGRFVYKETFEFYKNVRVKIKLRNTNEFSYFQNFAFSSNFYVWSLYKLDVFFYSYSTTIKSAWGESTRETLTQEGFFFFDNPSALYIGNFIQKYYNGFIYSITIWQQAISDYSDFKDICGGQLYAGCLWNCSILEYYNEFDKKYWNCDKICINGCGSFGSCNKCHDINCLSCSSYMKGSTCTAVSSNPCLPGLDYINQASCCTYGCAECYGLTVLKCFKCINGYYLLGTACYSDCPIGFNSVNSFCSLANTNLLYEVLFESLDGIAFSTNNLVSFVVPNPSLFLQGSDPFNPVPAKNRGYYFSTFSYMQSSLFEIPYNFTMSFWIKTYKDGILFLRNNLQVNSNLSMIYLGIKYDIKLTITPNWKILSVSANTKFNGDHLICLSVIETSYSVKCISLVETYFFDGKQTLNIGNDSSSFQGFVWKSRLYYQNITDDPNSLKLCSSSITENCIWNCTHDKYFDGSSCKNCSNCSIGCVRDSDCNLCKDVLCVSCQNFTSVCSKCFSNSSLQSGLCGCSEGFYWNKSLSICKPCHPLCKTCQGDLNCTACHENSVIINNICKCIQSYFYLSVSGICSQCDVMCLNCFGPKNFQCVSCISDMYLKNNSCFCYDGYFWDGSFCQSCDSLCAYCDSKGCITCKNNLIIIKDNTCACNTGQYLESDYCQKCHKNCLNCFSGSMYDCTQCREGAILEERTCKCIKKSFMNDSGFCEPCHETCLDCSGKERSDCLECDWGLTPQLTGDCFCPENHFWNESLKICSNCSRYCLDCKNDYKPNCFICSQECLHCPESFTSIRDFCVCAPGKYLENGRCHPCHEDCLTCFNKTFYSCTSCLKSLMNGVCYTSCPIGSSSLNESCFFTNELISLKFQENSIEISDFSKKIKSRSCKENLKIIQSTSDPFPIISRGVYFNGHETCLEVSQVASSFLFSNTFELSFWIRLLDNGPIFTIFDYFENWNPLVFRCSQNSSYLMIELEVFNMSYSMIRSFQPSRWAFVSIEILYFNFSVVKLGIGDDFEVFMYLRPEPFRDGKSFLLIGTDLISSFHGFVFQVNFNNFETVVWFDFCDGCIECPAFGECLPICNLDEYYNETSKTCLNCKKECSQGCRDDKNCGMCLDPNCKSCQNYEQNSCLACNEGTALINNTCQTCLSGQYFESKSKTCEPCNALCSECITLNKCSSCIKNSQKQGDICVCELGFKEFDLKCIKSMFYVYINTNINKEINLLFSEGVKKESIQKSLKVLINGKSTSFKIKEINKFTFQIQFIKNLQKTNKIEFLFEKLDSLSHSSLFNKTAEMTVILDEEEDLKTEESRKYARQAILAILGISAISGIMTMDLTSLFNFMNFAEIFSTISLFEVDLPEPLLEFLRSVRIQKNIPNLIAKSSSKSSEVDLNQNFVAYGFESNKMIVNSGTNLVIFSVIFLLFLIISCFSGFLVKKFPKFSVIRDYFRFKIFLEFWLQTSLEFLITSGYSLSLKAWSSSLDIFDYSLSVFILVVQFSAFGYVFYVFYKRSCSSYQEKEVIDSKFGYLFKNFKENKISLVFHHLFFVRRLMVAALIFFPVSSVIRLILSSVVSMTMIFYLGASFCFKSKIMNLLHLINEILTFIMICLIFYYQIAEKDGEFDVKRHCFNVVTCSWAFNCFFSLLHGVVCLFHKIKDRLSKRNLVQNEVSTEYHIRNRPIKIGELFDKD